MNSKKLRKKLLSTVLAVAMMAGTFSCVTINTQAAGADLWVDAVNGSDANDGSSASSAFKTIQAAKSAAAAKSADSDVTVYVKGGTYQVDEAITFGAADSGKNGHTITYKAASGETPVISGGTEVTGWTIYDADKNIWKAPISDKAAESRQFYVDGKHQTRAMTEVSPTSWEIMGSGGYISPYVEDQNTNEYVIMDLGEEKAVSYVVLYPNATKDRDGKMAGFPQDFTIETSIDGNEYTVQYTETGHETPKRKAGVVCKFDEVQARYVKLNVTKLGTAELLRPDSYALSLSEMEVGVKGSTIEGCKVDFDNNILTKSSQVEFVGYYSADGSRTSHVHGATPVENLVDGSTGTFVSTGGFLQGWLTGAGGTLNPAVVVDVSENGQAVPVSAVELNSRVVGSSVVNYATDFAIQTTTSENPEESDWITVTTQNAFDWTKDDRAIFIFKERNVKKVRVLVSNLDGSEDGSNYMLQLTEMAVYHDQQAEAAPQAETASETGAVRSENLLTDVSQIKLVGHYDNGNEVSYVHGGTPIANLVDGNKETFTSTGGYVKDWLISGGGSLAPSIVLNVAKDGQAVSVSSVELSRRSGEQLIGVAKDFKIQVSEYADPTEEDWTTVVTKTDFDWSESTVMFEFEKCNAAAIRIQTTKLDGSEDGTNYMMQFAEIAVYGSTSTGDESAAEKNLLTSESQIKFLGHYENGVQRSYVSPDYPLSNLMDGDKSTCISSQGYWNEWLTDNGGTCAPSLVVDVSKNGNPAMVSSIEISSCLDVCQAKNFKIQISDIQNSTEVDWVTVASEENYNWNSNLTYTCTFAEPKEVCEIRVQATDLNGKINATDYQLRFTEMAVYGEESQGTSGKPGVTLPDANIIYCDNTKEAVYKPAKIDVKNDNKKATYNAKKLADGYLYEEVVHYGYSIPESDALSLARPEDLEINVLRWWYHRILKVSGMAEDGTEVYFDDSVLSLVQDESNTSNVSWLENAYEFIDTAGEWYINKEEKAIYYKPDGTMEGKTAILPITEQVLVFDGCSNVTFDGFEFAYTTWTRPSVEGHIDAQSGTYHTKQGIWGDVPGGIQIGDGSNVKITNSRIHNFGTGGVRIMNHTSNCEISDCAIYDISSVGIWVGNNSGHSVNCGEETLVKDNTIKNNYITRVGLDIFDSAGITVLYTEGTVVDHNEICNTPYTGISLGWGWDWNPSACAKNNIVSNNYIHDTGLTTHDGGSIYTLGNQNGSKLVGNYVHTHGDPENSKDIGLYLDEGSEGIEIYENVVGPNVYWWSSMWTTSIKNNHWHDNYHQVKNERDNGTNNVVENNTHVPDGNFSKYPKAQQIIDNAGLLDESVKTGVATGSEKKHQVSLTEYENTPSYYFSQEDGLTSFVLKNQIGNTQYNRRTRLIDILMPEGTDVSDLEATLVCKNGYELVGEMPKDFTNAVTIQLQKDGNIVTWTIRVKVDVTANGPLVGTEITLDKAIENPGDWTVAPTANTDGSITFRGSNSAYLGARYKTDAILEFDMKMGLNTESKDWAGFAIRVQNPREQLGTMYHVCINNGSIEVQKWVNGERTMLYGTIEGFKPVYGDLSNDFFTADEVHSIKTGAIDVPQGVRLFMYVDGNKVFDVIDTDNPISDTGFFAVYPMTQAITLSKYTNIQKIVVDFSELEDCIKDAETIKADNYTAESYAALSTALTDAKAVLADAEATQEDVDHALTALLNAMDSLELKQDDNSSSDNNGSDDKNDKPSGDEDKTDKPSDGEDKVDKPSGDEDKTDKPSGGEDKTDKPSGDEDKTDKPSGGEDKIDKPSGGEDKTDKPSSGEDKTDKPSGGTTTKPSGGNGSAGIKTGDSANIAGLCMILGISAVAAVVIVMKKRRENA